MASTDASGNVTTCAFDRADRQTQARGAAGAGETVTTYNALGWVTERKDADGISACSRYDNAGRVTSETVGVQSNLKTTRSEFSPTGQLLRRTDPDGKALSCTYDAFGRLAHESQVTSAGPVKDAEMAYDSLSRLTTSTDTRTGIVTTSIYPTVPGQTTSTAITISGMSTTVTVDAAGSGSETIEMLTRSIQNKILHGPITELKDGAGQPGHGALVHLVRKIFGIAE